MDAPWQQAAQRRAEFDAEAVAYDENRPRYPEAVFDTIIGAVGKTDATVVEIGAGTGIASEPLARRGLRVIGIEPAPAMAEIARAKLAGRGEVIDLPFEEWEPTGPADLVAAFTSWHWVDPSVGVAKVASVLRPGGLVALTWIEVVQYGQEPFDQLSGYDKLHEPLADAIEPHLRPFDEHGGFGERTVCRFRFERVLDADRFVAESRTYPGPHSENRDAEIRCLINKDFGGAITKVEDAVLHLYTRT